MDLINHQDTGATGLRIAATVLVILGWFALLISVFMGMIDRDTNFFVMVVCGLFGLGVFYLLACLVRGFASLVEAAQLYWNLNAPVSEEDYTEE